MGTNPAQSAADMHGRFHHLSDAYCADQALFPHRGSANPVLTGLTLARRVSEAVIARV
jgi:choline dehydrogenase-like flavoprotein